jgi:hypothetical protein
MPIEDPRRDRQRVLALYLRVALGCVLLLALATAVLPDSVSDGVGGAMIAVLILAPIGRVVWFLVRWTRRGDRRYAAAAVALLLVMASGLLLA